MLKVAGRPVMDWVMDRLDGLGVTELIFITGHLKEQVEAYARSRYAIPQRFIEQKVQDGTAGAVNLARPHIHEPVLIIFVDTVFEADLTLINRTDATGSSGPRKWRTTSASVSVVTDAQGYMTRIVEKPSEPISRSPTSASTTCGRWTACGRGSIRCWHGPRTRANISSRRLPVDDRARKTDPDRGSRWLV
jgi:glucose-1-phosphate thymidylyltransferase